MRKKSLWIVLICLIAAITVVPVRTQAKGKVHKIRTASDWKKISKYKGGRFKVMKNIKLSEKQYCKINKNKKYIIDLNGKKVVTTYNGVEMRSVSPLSIYKGNVILTSSVKSKKKSKGVLYGTEGFTVFVTGKSTFTLQKGAAVINDAVEFRSDAITAIVLADKAKCNIKNNSVVRSVGGGINIMGKNTLTMTGKPQIRAGYSSNTGMFTHYGNGICVNSTGAKLSLKGGSIGTMASPDADLYGVSYAMSANYPILDTTGKVLKKSKKYKFVDGNGQEVKITGSNLDDVYPGFSDTYGGEKKVTTKVADKQGSYNVYIVKR